jgi:single-strand DNA-binding protein
MSLANISIVGNLVKPPEQMQFVSGKVKTTFTVAVNGFGRPARGGDTADFYRVETWGKLAELAGKYLDKGNQIGVSGRLLFDRFVDQQGKNRVIPVVEANQLSLPPRPKTGEENSDRSSHTADLGVPIGGQILVDDQIDSIEEIFSGRVVDEGASADFNLVEIDNKVKAKSKKQEKIAVGQ